VGLSVVEVGEGALLKFRCGRVRRIEPVVTLGDYLSRGGGDGSDAGIAFWFFSGRPQERKI
jgi:hypothetical protein